MIGVTGRYYADCNDSRCSNLAADEIEARNLWLETQALVQKKLSQSYVAKRTLNV